MQLIGLKGGFDSRVRLEFHGAKVSSEAGLFAVRELHRVPGLAQPCYQALQTATPQICNSDQGSQFTSPQGVSLLQEVGVSISMDGKRRTTDNIFVERLWRTVKYEEVYLHDYQTPREARQR